MNELRDRLAKVVSAMSGADRVGLLLSAGMDSISVGITCQELGKSVCAYTYEIQGYRSREREKVEVIARHFGWPLKVIRVPRRNLAADFKRLVIQFRCRTKVQSEVLFPLLYIFPEIEEQEVWSGFNADDHYGNTRKAVLEQARLVRGGVDAIERKRRFDDYRDRVYAEFDAPGSADSWWFAKAVAKHFGKNLFDPYVDASIREYFRQFDHDELSPLGKPLIRQAFEDRLSGLPDNMIAKGERLQKGGRVHELTMRLLEDPDVNRFEPASCTTMSTLCQRWAKVIATNPAHFESELATLLPQPRASVRLSQVGQYASYFMADVRAAADGRKFSFLSMFAGGGGSSIGYRLAGGEGRIVNEFVPEAARTYRANFPECIVDPRDIRDISHSDEAVAEFLAKARLAVGEIDVVDGSPPCAEFSFAGRGIGDQDVLRPYSDVKQANIASLPFDAVDFVHRARPKVFVLENVPAFETRAPDVYQRVLHYARFGEGGVDRRYYVHGAVLVASEYGVPQKRQRLFVIGVRKDVGDTVGFNSDEAICDLFPPPTKVGVTVRSALAGLSQREQDVWPWVRSAIVGRLSPLIRELPKELASPQRPNGTKNYTLTRCAWDKPAPTLVVTGQRPDGLTGAIHPREDRKFTLPELKRLTGLPDDFVLTGTLGQMAERVCRMVPPFLTKAIAESVYEKILRPYSEKKK
jgi:site-specific DNA-cytosine methylase